LKLSNGPKAKNCHPKSFKIPKTQQSAQALKESKRGKKRKKGASKCSKLPKN
jgi:hypothetical protein